MFSIPDHPTIRIAIALAIGLVVGVERGWRERAALPGQRTAGLRTFILIAFLGALIGVLAQAMKSDVLLGLGFVAFAGVFAWFKMHEAMHDDDFSVTGAVAGLLVFVLGAMCIVDDAQIAAGSGVVLALILASREAMHGLIKKLTWPELRSALLLLAMSVIVLPVLPNVPVAALGGINPGEIWLFTVFTAAISFTGYAAVKWAGPSNGIVISALAGALVSSTAVTIVLARRAACGESAVILAGGASLAGFISLVRTAIIATILAPDLLVLLAAPVAAAALVFLTAGFFLVRSANQDGAGESTLGNPLELKPLLLFAAAFAGVSALSGWLTARYGQNGIYASSAIFGLLDIDVATLTAARLSGRTISHFVAAHAILIALAINAAARVAYAMVIGPAALSIRLLAVTVLASGSAMLTLLMAS